MFSYFFGGKTDPKEEEIKAITDKILQNPALPELSECYHLLLNYIPNYTEKILSQVANNMVSVLMTPADEQPVFSAILDLLLKMIDEADSSIQGSDPVGNLCNHPNLPNALFLSTYPLNRSINKIIDYFFIHSPDTIVVFAKMSPRSLMLLMKTVIESQDDEAGNLFHRIVVSKNELLDEMMQHIEPVFRQFPVTTVIDFMIRSPNRLRHLIPDTEIENWLLQHSKFSLFDIQQVMSFFKFLWNKPIAAQFLTMTEANQEIEQLHWLRRMPPQTFTLTPEDARQTAEAFLNPPAPLKSITENYGKKAVVKNSYQTFIFVRLFVLSLAQPSDVPENAIGMILKFLFDANEWISAGAIQLLLIWITKHNFQVAPGIVYRIAAAVFDSTKSESFVSLSKALLKALNIQYKMVVSILSTEPELMFTPKELDSILTGRWCFPHLRMHLENLGSIELVNFDESLKALGYIVSSLGLDENPEE